MHIYDRVTELFLRPQPHHHFSLTSNQHIVFQLDTMSLRSLKYVDPRKVMRSLSPRITYEGRRSLKIAVEGCCHGELDAIYSHISQLERRNQYKVDLLLICGDFEAIRNPQDMECMSVPQKYKVMGDFHKYYTGEKRAPLLTIVIGGNHEASNYFWELYHGGWLAPNIYFLGHSGSVKVNGLNIAGASGIYKAHDFQLGNYEKMPYDSRSLRSIYHTREYCIRKLSLLPSNHIFMSHDWPQYIEQYGDTKSLVKRNPHFRRDVETGLLGSPPLMELLRTLRPEWWFAAHMHTRFEATVEHQGPPPRQPVRKPDGATTQRATTPSETQFLALDKCLPNRDFLEVIDLAVPEDDAPAQPASSTSAADELTLSYDPDWLAITRAFHPLLSTTRQQPPFPDEVDARALIAKEREWVLKNIPTNSRGEIPVMDYQQFAMTAPGPGTEGSDVQRQPRWYTNPQTVALCRMLDIPNKINPPPKSAGGPRH
ncbi:hypothetical protein D9619_004265 [Psilocybe cf. subviscida]|uniref:Lariat debranching enzyme C-terminal domain-containing protein n=1 Tax=Psilocybe cf. subviscida TaxID=2480587 RepID=A0A8H5BS41_9AGAR|nr:hypothetical protein D9619_004265 [Psilocybe cf. subviscida]